MKFFHKHKWIYQDRGTGYYRKGKQKINLNVEGHAAKCDCGKKMFFPDDPTLNPVEVVSPKPSKKP